MYWRNLYRESKAAMAKDQRIINDLQELYLEWKGKFLNLDRFANLNMLEFLEKLQVYWCMCPETHRVKLLTLSSFIRKWWKSSLRILQWSKRPRCSLGSLVPKFEFELMKVVRLSFIYCFAFYSYFKCLQIKCSNIVEINNKITKRFSYKNAFLHAFIQFLNKKLILFSSSCSTLNPQHRYNTRASAR